MNARLRRPERFWLADLPRLLWWWVRAVMGGERRRS